MASQPFPKHRRLRARLDFVGLQKRGRRFSRGSVVLIVARSFLGAHAKARLGLVVSRKVGNAVERNRLKRRLRDWFRKNKSLPRGVDLLVIAKPGLAEATLGSLAETLNLLVKGISLEKLA